jgi:hypothetical protein
MWFINNKISDLMKNLPSFAMNLLWKEKLCDVKSLL